MEVINLSGTAVTLGQTRTILPLGGLRPVSKQWAPCGAILPSSGIAAAAAVLSAVRHRLAHVTFGVLIACPRPLPVQFIVSYREHGRTGTTQLPGFSDLGQATYTGCKGNS